MYNVIVHYLSEDCVYDYMYIVQAANFLAATFKS